MKIRVAGFTNDSIVDGPGLRFTVFAQGCAHNCKGCHNTHTHAYDGGELYETDEIARMVKENPLLDGVTFSGGEPFDQPAAFAELANKLDGYDIFCYTGYLFEELIKSEDADIASLLNSIDVLVDGPFIEDKRSLGLRFKGSSNQRIINLKESMLNGEAILRNL